MTAPAILDPVQTKTCTKCGEAKAFSFFHKQKLGKFGIESVCKSCRRDIDLLRYKKTRTQDQLAASEEKIRADLCGLRSCPCCKTDKPKNDFLRRPNGMHGGYCKGCRPAFYKARKIKSADKDKKRRSEFYKNNKQVLLLKNKEYRILNKESYLKTQKVWRDKNKEYISTKNKEWVSLNKERKSTSDREYRKNKYKTDPHYAMRMRVKSLIQVKIRAGGYTKKSRTSEILGCDWECFKGHIERQFLKKMTWDNRNEWHIDHIIPVSSAKSEDEFLALNHFTNMRPMWAKDNLLKSDRITHLI